MAELGLPPMLEKLKFLDIGIQGFALDLGGSLVSHTGGVNLMKPHPKGLPP